MTPALLAIPIAAFLLGKVLWMLRQPESRRYRHPAESVSWIQVGLFALIPLVAFLTGHWVAGLILTAFVPLMYLLARWNVQYHRYRQRKGKP